MGSLTPMRLFFHIRQNQFTGQPVTTLMETAHIIKHMHETFRFYVIYTYARTDTETKRKAIENAYPDLI